MVHPKSDHQYYIDGDSKSIKQLNAPPETVRTLNKKNEDGNEEYSLARESKGKAIIFNHTKFVANLGLSELEGSKVDRERIKKTLVSLGFEIEICDNFTFCKIKERLKKVSEEDHSGEDCLIVVVMSHGTSSKLYAYDEAYDEQELWKPFSGNNCPTLKGKPKLFFIEACRGTKDGTGSFPYTTRNSIRQQSNIDEPTGVIGFVPNSPDLLIARSTFEGYKSYRNPEGSRFIQTLCNELEADLSRDNANKYDLMRILTNVNRIVAFNYPTEIVTEKKQMPKIYSTLTKLVYFRSND